MRLAILQQSYGRFGGAERLALSHYIQLRRMGRDIIARSFFRPSFNPTDISAREEKIMKLLISQVRSSFLVSSSKGLHYQTIEKIPEMFPMEEQTISHTIHKGSAARPS